MSRSKHPKIPNKGQEYRNLLDQARDTVNTFGGPKPEGSQKSKYNETTPVEPPFKGDGGSENYVTHSEVRLTWKVAGVLGLIVLGVVVPSVWFASTINSSVNGLQKDVKDVKTKTERLIESSIRQDDRLDSLSTSIKELHADLQKERSRRQK